MFNYNKLPTKLLAGFPTVGHRQQQIEERKAVYLRGWRRRFIDTLLSRDIDTEMENRTTWQVLSLSLSPRWDEIEWDHVGDNVSLIGYKTFPISILLICPLLTLKYYRHALHRTGMQDGMLNGRENITHKGIIITDEWCRGAYVYVRKALVYYYYWYYAILCPATFYSASQQANVPRMEEMRWCKLWLIGCLLVGAKGQMFFESIIYAACIGSRVM